MLGLNTLGELDFGQDALIPGPYYPAGLPPTRGFVFTQVVAGSSNGAGTEFETVRPLRAGVVGPTGIESEVIKHVLVGNDIPAGLINRRTSVTRTGTVAIIGAPIRAVFRVFVAGVSASGGDILLVYSHQEGSVMGSSGIIRSVKHGEIATQMTLTTLRILVVKAGRFGTVPSVGRVFPGFFRVGNVATSGELRHPVIFAVRGGVIDSPGSLVRQPAVARQGTQFPGGELRTKRPWYLGAGIWPLYGTLTRALSTTRNGAVNTAGSKLAVRYTTLEGHSDSAALMSFLPLLVRHSEVNPGASIASVMSVAQTGVLGFTGLLRPGLVAIRSGDVLSAGQIATRVRSFQVGDVLLGGLTAKQPSRGFHTFQYTDVEFTVQPQRSVTGTTVPVGQENALQSINVIGSVLAEGLKGAQSARTAQGNTVLAGLLAKLGQKPVSGTTAAMSTIVRMAEVEVLATVDAATQSVGSKITFVDLLGETESTAVETLQLQRGLTGRVKDQGWLVKWLEGQLSLDGETMVMALVDAEDDSQPFVM